MLKDTMTKFSMAELSKILSERWKKLTPEEKQPYIDRSKEAKRVFVEQYGDNTKKGMRSAAASALPAGWKVIKDVSSGASVYLNTVTKQCKWVLPVDGTGSPLEPATFVRKPKSACSFFVAHAKSFGSDSTQAITAQWKTLTAAEKAPFVLLHEEDVRRYNAEKQQAASASAAAAGVV